jgi:hypothetical protein
VELVAPFVAEDHLDIFRLVHLSVIWVVGGYVGVWAFG